MTPKRTIAAQWDAMRAVVVPTNAPEAQVRDMKRSFYAGAHALFALMSEVGDDAVGEDEGVSYFESLNQELRAFTRAVQEGKA
jgi:hypothetical protein